MGPDLKSKRWIIAKGVLFVVLAGLSGTLVLLDDGILWRRASLLAICIWASCRFYYFLFHVLHAYVDPDLPSGGVLELIRRVLSKRK